jgi:multisubunit Na+/H+ antiporter MnhB subunit/multisubunit Na+/H+ antiporter MnhC subunit
MSAVALVGGVAMYFALQRHFNLHLHHPRGWTGRLIFTHAIDGLFALSGRFTQRLENGSLQRYAAWMLGCAVLLAAWPWLTAQGVAPGAGTRTLLSASPLALVAWALLIAAGTALVMGHHDRFRAVVLVGVVGLVTALTFLAFSAPDLALTQLSVEVVSTALLLMGLALLPQTTPRESSVRRKARDALLALAGGGGIAWITWLMLTRDHDSIAWYFLDNSVVMGGGTNAVNVILVDFRGYDTFGEITVLGIAAVGVLALLDGFRVRRPEADPQGRTADAARGRAHRAAAGAGGQRLHLLARPQPARRRLHRRPGHGDRAGASVHGARPGPGRVRPARRRGAPLHPLDRHRAGHRGAHRRGRVRVRPAFPDQRLRTPGGAGAGRNAAGHGGAVRPRRLHHRGRRNDADALGAWRGEQGAARMISMELLVATGVGWVTACGIYLLLRGRTFPVVLGLTLLGYAVNVFIFAMGRLWSNAAPIVAGTTAVADPLPQALVLTAIVIGFATTGFVIELALRSRHESGTDQVDGQEPRA